MRLDKYDIFPLSVVIIFGMAIPLALWLGFGSRQQIVRDVHDAAKYFAVVSISGALFVAWFAIRQRRREKRFLAERGEQSAADFATLFANESEKRAATLLFHRLRGMTSTGRMPRLERDDVLSGPPLFLVFDDLAEQIEELCQEHDICTYLDPDARIALFNSKTISQLVSALARFVEQQGMKSPAVTA